MTADAADRGTIYFQFSHICRAAIAERAVGDSDVLRSLGAPKMRDCMVAETGKLTVADRDAIIIIAQMNRAVKERFTAAV